MTCRSTQVALLASAAVFFAAASCDIDAPDCEAKVEADQELHEVILLQKDLRLHKRAKKEEVQVQIDGIVDHEARKDLPSSTVLAQEKADQELHEVVLLQKDLRLHKRTKTEEVQVQIDGIVDHEARKDLPSSPVPVQEKAPRFAVAQIGASWSPDSPLFSPILAAGGMVPSLQNDPLSMRWVLDNEEVVATTTTYNHRDNAAASGVKTNGAGDLLTFVSGLFTNVFMMVFCVAFFMYVKELYPSMYSNNLNGENKKMTQIDAGLFGWCKASWRASSSNGIMDVMEDRGLDMALCLKFMDMSSRIMACIGLPMFLLMGPVNCVFGGHAAGMDHLSYLSFGNVENGSKLYWIHAFVVWGVVIVARHFIFQSQGEFMELRQTWLQRLPKNRASTILVECIPEEYQSQEKLKEFFTDLFGAGKVQSTYLVRNTAELEEKENSKAQKEQALEKLKKTLDEDKAADVSFYGEALQRMEGEIKQLNEDINAICTKMKVDPVLKEYRTSSGFVTFTDVSDATLAQSVQISEEIDEWEVYAPPDPSSVLWHDLQQHPTEKAGLTVVGYLLVAGLYMAYMPSVIGITQIAVSINMGPLQPLWAAFAPTMGLQFMVAFLPTFLVIIFRFCFTLRDGALAQQRLQNWYFVFQLVFVILITAIGAHMYTFLDTLVEKPMEVFSLLGTTMPFATHFYMNYLVLQWASHALVLTRYIPLLKFIFFSKLFDAETARAMSEPEDQDYYGIGSRSCRMSINLCIGLIYGTLSPPITILTWIEFFICRVVYGYLIPFAESKKPDLGGHFWVNQLKHVFVGLIVYCIVMIGVLLGRSDSNGPGVIAAGSLGYVIWQYTVFNNRFSGWENLSFQWLKMNKKDASRKPDSGQYVQPFMLH